MEIDLSIIGMERGRQYETIITTKNAQNVYNAAPIGVLCSGPDRIVNRIFKGSHTLENIINTGEFVVLYHTRQRKYANFGMIINKIMDMM